MHQLPAIDEVTHLNPLTFPLHGSRLIEASAGTGKTYTIAGLYLRLLLGHGDTETRPCQSLSVEQILVVTFTEAATAELRGRIRARIHEARLAFARHESDEPLLQSLLADVEDHEHAVRLLLQAERDMDTAAIYTIHGFCQRMLVQNAFESGSRFQNEFITDESRLKAQVVADYWRCNFYALSVDLAKQIKKLWPTPAALLKQIGVYLTGNAPTLSVAAMTSDLEALHQSNLAHIKSFKQVWQQHCDEILPVISASDVNKRSYTKKSLPQWIEQVSVWAASETTSDELPEQLVRFSQQVLREKTPKGEPPEHLLFAAVDSFLSQPISLEAPLLAHAIETCRYILARTKREKQWLSFDDLLSYLSAALIHDSDQRLSERIRTLYPVAMIDEFQDTDPLQYHIFSQIYATSSTHGLFMIGDPKQAIYGFRGADIFTYMKARRQVSSHFTLATNWRSSQDMVSAVNDLFSSAHAPFLYDDDIPFYPVSASPQADKRYWVLEDARQPAMTYWWPEHQETYLTKGDYDQWMAEATAAQIQTILQLSQDGQGYLVSGQERKPIQAGHIAVLVRTGSEGRLVKEALARQGVASVYLSNRDSVFTSSVAQDVQRLLQAVLAPENERTLRAALASPLFMLDIFYLDQLNSDELLWEHVVQEFRDYRQIWSDRGVMPMLRAVLNQRQLAERWLIHPNGERTLTDFMHIGELLQQAASEIDSDHGLVRWFSQSVEDTLQGLSNQDESIQRLESEKNLVQIITIHKSKGLEFDLVFLPFVMRYREAQEAKYHDDRQEQTVLDLTRAKTSLSYAEKERLAEDLRLLYVALTRAVYGCYLGIAPLQQGRSKQGDSSAHLSAMGYLLQQGQPGDATRLRNGIEAMSNQYTHSVLSVPPQLQDMPMPVQQGPTPSLDVQILSKPIERRWRMTSYSNLVKQSGHHGFLDATFEPRGFDIDSAGEAEDIIWGKDEKNVFTFPKGATPGTFLHSLFEQIEFSEPASSESNTQVMIELMNQASVDPEWLPTLQSMIDQVLTTPLDGQALRLADIPAEKRLTELEFLLPIEVLQAPLLNRLIRQYDTLSAQADLLGFAQVEGMLKGFIDLVFEFQGKYYLLDWKSNHLGNQSEDYHSSRLNAAMIAHRYDLQYQIYTLALHRFLATRLPHYTYKQHFGGVYYIFLRGVNGQAEQGIFSHRPKEAFIHELDRLIAGKIHPTKHAGHEQMEMDL